MKKTLKSLLPSIIFHTLLWLGLFYQPTVLQATSLFLWILLIISLICIIFSYNTVREVINKRKERSHFRKAMSPLFVISICAVLALSNQSWLLFFYVLNILILWVVEQNLKNKKRATGNV